MKVTNSRMPLSWSLLLLPLFGFYLVLFPGAIGYALFARRLKDYLDRGAYVASAMLANLGTLGGVCAFILYNETGFAYTQLIRGGHVDAVVLGGLEVDQEGSLANWIIPGKKMPGMGGAMDLCVGAKKCIVCMEHTAKGNPKIFEKCRLPLTASHCVNKIITEMCVLEVTDKGLVMTEINPEFTVDEVKAATAAPITVSENLKSMVD